MREWLKARLRGRLDERELPFETNDNIYRRYVDRQTTEEKDNHWKANDAIVWVGRRGRH